MCAGVAAAIAIDLYWQRQLELARNQYVEVETARAHEAVVRVQAGLTQIYQNIRTISFLPGVTGVDRHGINLTSEARATIQQVYNNLASNIAVSEVYLLPADFNPDAIDPATGHHEEPILAFDQLIVGTHQVSTETEDSSNRPPAAHDFAGIPDLAGNPQVEIEEYRRIRVQLQFMQLHYPTRSSFDGMAVPIIGSGPVITCDNSEFDFTHADADRMGIVQLVPFYDESGKLAGGVAAVMRLNAYRALLPRGDFALINRGYGVSIAAAGGQASRSTHWIDQALPDPDLVYSAVLPIASADMANPWQFWVGRSNADYDSAPAIANARFARLASLIGIVALTLGAVIVVMAISRAVARSRDALAAKAESRSKSSFLATMSHEIRTPLNGILGMAELMAESQLDDRQRAQLGIIRQSGDMLLSIINDVLDLSKLQSGAVDLESLPVDVAELAQAVSAMMSARADAKDLTLSCAVPQLTITGDPTRLKQILVNLVGNAIKFTDTGEVSLSARIDENGPQSRLEFKVRDTGIGMSPEVLGTLFQDFQQADPSITRRFGGTGLGLAISKRLVAAMGGTIEVESDLGRGTTFTVRLPYRPAPAQPTQAPSTLSVASPAPAVTRLRILLVEDNEINRQVALGFLRGLDADTRIAANGREALDAAAAATFDLILMDMQMPEMDGLTATRLLRDTGATTAIYGLSANAFTSDRDACLAAGMDGFLSKPVTREKLAGVLAEVARKAGATRESAAGPAQRTMLIDELGADAYATLLSGFVAEAHRALVDVREGNAQTRHMALRNLGSMADTLGLEAISTEVRAAAAANEAGNSVDLHALLVTIEDLHPTIANAA